MLDSGQAYGERTGSAQGTGNTYGWVTTGTSTPLNLAADGRVRTGTGVSDVKATTFVHMQRVATTAGSWEVEVPNGNYTVTVASVTRPRCTTALTRSRSRASRRSTPTCRRRAPG